MEGIVEVENQDERETKPRKRQKPKESTGETKRSRRTRKSESANLWAIYEKCKKRLEDLTTQKVKIEEEIQRVSTQAEELRNKLLEYLNK